MMTGADGTYDYKAMASGIVLAGGEGMGNLLPVVEKELLHYRILDAMMREGFFSSLVFQGGTSLRLCHGSPRYSEDLDFAGGTSFDMDTLKGLGSCISDSLSGMGDDVTVRVKEPRPDADGLTRRWRIAIRTAGQRKDLPSQTIKLEVASIPAYEPQHRPALVNYPMFPALSGQIILDVESPTEILADKLLSYACASHLRRRDLWDMCWLASRGDVDSRRAMELAESKSSDYGEEGLWADRADRVAGVADVIGSDAFADEMRRFLPAGLMTSTVESPRWSAWAIEQIGTLYGTPGTPSSADAVPGFPIFGASNDSSPNARYLSRFQAPRERRTLFARTESDIAAAFREETANHSWNADDLASQAGIDPRFADALLQRGEAPIEAVFSAADA
ncbi:nucleotidyl transferase AbiEii/AbiGii toxin family protein, partial [Bifidobacterium longum]|nr:nucleotidyl transferase AbiEii/AbiGii toxin family protein [Bifidobacterium longum]MDB6555311.1 nucleotidyl transferase AbiEii/AbiGii toxin family protein [Bifidobacterium longum]